jgi:hypothetical protein
MDAAEIELVLANFIAQATGPPGELSPGIVPARWVAQQFLRWWYPQVADELSDAESAVMRSWRELERLGGWSNKDLGETMHELIHARDALGTLRGMLGLLAESQDPAPGAPRLTIDCH